VRGKIPYEKSPLSEFVLVIRKKERKGGKKKLERVVKSPIKWGPGRGVLRGTRGKARKTLRPYKGRHRRR